MASAVPDRLLPILLSAVLALGLGACSGGDDEAATTTVATDTTTTLTAAPTTAAPTPATSTPAPTSDEEAVLAAVEGYWESFFAANNPPDPASPALSRYRTGDVLTVAIDNIAERESLGQYVRLPEGTAFHRNPVVISVDGEHAVVVDCVIDDSELVQSGSDTVLDGEIETSLFRMELVVEGSRWKVDSNSLQDQWDGATECDAH